MKQHNKDTTKTTTKQQQQQQHKKNKKSPTTTTTTKTTKEPDYVMSLMSTYGQTTVTMARKLVVTGKWGGKPGPLRSGIQRWFTTTSCTAMLWMTTMESDTRQSA